MKETTSGPVAARPAEVSAAKPHEVSTAHPRKVSAAHPHEVSTAHPQKVSAAHPHEVSTAHPHEVSTAVHPDVSKPVPGTDLPKGHSFDSAWRADLVPTPSEDFPQTQQDHILDTPAKYRLDQEVLDAANTAPSSNEGLLTTPKLSISRASRTKSRGSLSDVSTPSSSAKYDKYYHRLLGYMLHANCDLQSCVC